MNLESRIRPVPENIATLSKLSKPDPRFYLYSRSINYIHWYFLSDLEDKRDGAAGMPLLSEKIPSGYL